MKLRTLDEKDALFMLEWLKDKSVSRWFRNIKADDITLDIVLDFIRNSQNDKQSYHFAITNENDEYLGTVSLKNIDIIAKNGEYAIALRRLNQRQGVGRFATEKVLQSAFEELKLEREYFNVLSDNKRAINFYEKFGFTYEGEFYKHVNVDNDLKSLKWYRMMRCEYEARQA